MQIPAISPALSPLSAAQANVLNDFTKSLTSDQSIWLLGFFTALNHAIAVQSDTAADTAWVGNSAAGKLTVLYASQTGNAAKIAKSVATAAQANGLAVELANLAEYKSSALAQAENVIAITSTQGDGDPPESAQSFFKLLSSKRAPKLDRMTFAILALGDSTYPKFCRAGVELEERFIALGAKAIMPRVDCDVDYQATSDVWQRDVLQAFSSRLKVPVVTLVGTSAAQLPASGPAIEYDKAHPFQAELLERIQLNGRGSAKQTMHLELSLEGSQIRYEPGDALGVIAYNCPNYVDEVLAATKLSAEAPVTVDGVEQPLRAALLQRFDVTTLSRPFLKEYLKLQPVAEIAALLAPGSEDAFTQYAKGREIIDVLTAAPIAGISPQQFVSTLRRIQPRYYSIASSLLAHKDEVHLLVGVNRYLSHGRERKGVCSTYLSERLKEGDSASVFSVSNPSFKLPANDDAPVIMIGPGTGVAPFRSFMEEREAKGSRGKNWLFFGDQHFKTDFLYQAEWLGLKKRDILTQLDVAFSRDGAEKVYVQHRLIERQRELYRWIQDGAYIYVCGDANKMASDVHGALVEVIRQGSGKDLEFAEASLDELQAAKRYQRDVY